MASLLELLPMLSCEEDVGRDMVILAKLSDRYDGSSAREVEEEDNGGEEYLWDDWDPIFDIFDVHLSIAAAKRAPGHTSKLISKPLVPSHVQSQTSSTPCASKTVEPTPTRYRGTFLDPRCAQMSRRRLERAAYAQEQMAFFKNKREERVRQHQQRANDSGASLITTQRKHRVWVCSYFGVTLLDQAEEAGHHISSKSKDSGNILRAASTLDRATKSAHRGRALLSTSLTLEPGQMIDCSGYWFGEPESVTEAVARTMQHACVARDIPPEERCCVCLMELLCESEVGTPVCTGSSSLHSRYFLPFLHSWYLPSISSSILNMCLTIPAHRLRIPLQMPLIRPCSFPSALCATLFIAAASVQPFWPPVAALSAWCRTHHSGAHSPTVECRYADLLPVSTDILATPLR